MSTMTLEQVRNVLREEARYQRRMMRTTPPGMMEKLADAIDAHLAQLARENDALRKALQFYADGHHFLLSDAAAWDTVSGESPNYWCDEAGTATVEDGSVARQVLPASPTPDKEG